VGTGVPPGGHLVCRAFQEEGFRMTSYVAGVEQR
jgi:hypothetical protein